MPQKKLHELPFMDIYLCLNGEVPAHYRQTISGKAGGHADELDKDVPPDFSDDVASITAFLREKFIGDEMGLTYEGIRLRAAKVTTAGGLIWAAMRRINEEPPKLEKLGLMPALLPHVRKLGERDGLILICGATGMGKTTTSCSVLADWLEQYGGVAFTIEDPVEYDLEG
ncbi:MAG TPA: ATPase, T2SS/T4P/T4SS family, partial [Alphaproteobacteria bacterium]|nr:ATPase, T2SS/T4P/T4SS family [Alphaproteobacteria bacterium]